MNIKNNKRRQMTLKKIESAFMEFLKDRDISQIKVSAICEQANINRSTFYANYVDVYDLADKIRGKLKDQVDRLLEQDFQWQNSEKEFLQLFRHMKENQTLYEVYFRLGYDKQDELSFTKFIPHKAYPDEVQLAYHIAFFKSGFNAIVKKWLDGGCKESPQQMQEILLNEYRGRLG